MAMGGVDANLGIDSEIGVDDEILSGLKISPLYARFPKTVLFFIFRYKLTSEVSIIHLYYRVEYGV